MDEYSGTGKTKEAAVKKMHKNACGRNEIVGAIKYQVGLYERKKPLGVGEPNDDYETAFVSAMQEAGISHEELLTRKGLRLDVIASAQFKEPKGNPSGCSPIQRGSGSITDFF